MKHAADRSWRDALSLAEIQRPHLHPNPHDEIWTRTAPWCRDGLIQSSLNTHTHTHTHTHTQCRVRLTQLTWRPHGTWSEVWRGGKKKRWEPFQLEGFKGEVHILVLSFPPTHTHRHTHTHTLLSTHMHADKHTMYTQKFIRLKCERSTSLWFAETLTLKMSEHLQRLSLNP